MTIQLPKIDTKNTANKKKFEPPSDTPVSCEECDFVGILSDCATAMDSEGWEYPDYEVLVCPKCEEYSINL